MSNYKFLKNNDGIFLSKINEQKVPCKHCGHKVVFWNTKQEKLICHWCNNYVYKNDKIEFKHKMSESIKKVKYENKTI